MGEPSLPRFRCVLLRRSGASEIRVVRAESADAARAGLVAAGHNPVSVEPIGPSLFDSLGERIAGGWRWPAWRPRRPTALALPPRPILLAAGLLLATIPLTTAIGAWSLTALNRWQAQRLAREAAPALAAGRRATAIEAVRPQVAAIMGAPTMTDRLARLAAVLPAEAGLVRFERDEAGELTLIVETPDPDRLRAALAADPGFAALRETGQTMTDGGTISVTLKGRNR